MKKFLLACMLFVGLNLTVFSQLETNVELRNRLEYRDGYKKQLLTTQDPSELMFQRARLNFNYKYEKFTLYVSLQDARIWGDDPSISSTGTGDNPSIALYKAYGEYKIDSVSTLTLGRQELKYDNQRMLGTRSWGNTGLSYDALVFKTNIKGLNIHAGLSWNNLTEVYSSNYYPMSRMKTQDFIWVNKSKNNFNLSFIQMFNGVTKSDTSDIIYMKQTSGVYFKDNIKNLTTECDFYYQWGENNKSQKVSSVLGNVDFKYTFKKKFELGAGFTYISGDDNTTDDIDKTFDLLYGKRHGWYGGMDYFQTISKDTKNGGLIDYYGYFSITIKKNIKFKNYTHSFNLAQTNTTTPVGTNLGVENDLVSEFKFGKNIILETGLSFLSPTVDFNTIKGTNGAKLQSFVYVQLNVNTDVFKFNK